MRFKRNALNYIVWGLLCVILFAGVGISAISVSEANSSSTYLFYVAVFYALFVFGCVLLMIAYRLLRKVWKEKVAPKFKINGLIETALVFVVVIAAIVLRFVFTLLQYDDLSAVTFSGTSAYYEYAIGNITTLGTASNIAYVFANSLKALFAVFSQTYIVVFVLQAFLALGEMLFIFYALKHSAGKIVAWIALLLTAFLPGSIALFTQCTPGLFLAFILSGYLFAAVEIILGSVKGRYSKNKYLLLFGFLGLFTGAICYFDIFGVALIPLTIYAFFVFRDKTKTNAASKPLIQSAVYLGTAIVTLGVSLFGFPSGVEAGVTGIARFVACFVPREGINLTLLTPLFGTWDALLLYVLAGFWVLAFLKTKTDKAFAFSVSVIFMVAFQFFTFDHTDYIPLISLCFAIIGAIGFSCLKFVFATDESLALFDKEEEDAFNSMIEQDKKRPAKKPLFGRGHIITLGNDLHADLVAEDRELNKEEPAKAEASKEETKEAEQVKDEPVKEETKEEVKTEEPKTEEPKTEESKAEEPKAEEVKVEPEKAEESEPVKEEIKAEEPAPVAKEVKAEEPAPVIEEAPAESEKVEEPVVEEVKAESEPVKEEVKPEPEKTEEPAKEEPKAESTEEKKEERVLPPYVPQKMMLRRRGKMFTPVKKSEESPEGETPQVEAAVAEEPKAEQPVAEEVKAEEPKVEEPKIEETKIEEPKAEEPAKTDEVVETTVPAAPVSVGNVVRKKSLPEIHSSIASLAESVKEIKNPLPGPKPHVSRELVFDYDVKDDEWDFDLKDLGDKDDYDI